MSCTVCVSLYNRRLATGLVEFIDAVAMATSVHELERSTMGIETL